jgi:uncharacterized membrane protein
MSLEPLFDAGPIIAVHALAAIAAFVLGIAQFALPKGTGYHRVLGWTWVALMAVVAISSFAIFELRLIGPFSPIHLLSIFTLGALIYAVQAARRRRVESHRQTMIWIFAGALVVAGAFTFMPGRIMYQVVAGG